MFEVTRRTFLKTTGKAAATVAGAPMQNVLPAPLAAVSKITTEQAQWRNVLHSLSCLAYVNGANLDFKYGQGIPEPVPENIASLSEDEQQARVLYKNMQDASWAAKAPTLFSAWNTHVKPYLGMIKHHADVISDKTNGNAEKTQEILTRGAQILRCSFALRELANWKMLYSLPNVIEDLPNAVCVRSVPDYYEFRDGYFGSIKTEAYEAVRQEACRHRSEVLRNFDIAMKGLRENLTEDELKLLRKPREHQGDDAAYNIRVPKIEHYVDHPNRQIQLLAMLLAPSGIRGGGGTYGYEHLYSEILQELGISSEQVEEIYSKSSPGRYFDLEKQYGILKILEPYKIALPEGIFGQWGYGIVRPAIKRLIAERAGPDYQPSIGLLHSMTCDAPPRGLFPVTLRDDDTIFRFRSIESGEKYVTHLRDTLHAHMGRARTSEKIAHEEAEQEKAWREEVRKERAQAAQKQKEASQAKQRWQWHQFCDHPSSTYEEKLSQDASEKRER